VEKLFFSALLVLGWVIPNRFIPLTSAYNDLAAWAGLFVIATGTLVRLHDHQVELPKLSVFVFLLTLVPWLQWLLGHIYFLEDALLASVYLGGFALAIVVGRNTATAEEMADWLSGAILFGALISVALALHQWLGLHQLGVWLVGMQPGGRPFANLGQPNNLASLLLLGIAASVYLRERGFYGGAVLGLLMLLLFAGIAMTRSRTALVAAAIISVWLINGLRLQKLKLGKFEILLGFMLFNVMWFSWPTLSDWLGLSVTGRRTEEIGSRSVMWLQLLDAAWREPWLGYGWNQVSVAQAAVAADYPRSEFTEHAHNLFIDLVCWNGLPLGSIAIAVVLAWLYVSGTRLRGLSAWYGYALILVLGTHAMFEYPLDYAYFLVPFGLAIGVVERSYADSVFRMPRWIPGIIVLLGVLVWIGIAYEYPIVRHQVDKLRYEAAGIVWREQANQQPIRLLTLTRDRLRLAENEEKEDISSSELEQVRKMAARRPSAPMLYRYARALALDGQYTAAANQLKILGQLHPTKYYEQAVDRWRDMVEKHPKLRNVELPPLPPHSGSGPDAAR